MKSGKESKSVEDWDTEMSLHLSTKKRFQGLKSIVDRK